jgi:hypothetical protein
MRTRIGGTASRAFAVVVIAAVAAGGALARSASPTPVQQALAKTTQAGSFQYKLSLLLASTGVGSGKQYTIAGSGASDFRHHKGTMTLDVGSLVSALGIKIGTQPLPSKLTLLTLNKVVYVHLPQLSTQYPGKQWLKIDPKTLPKSQTGGADIGGLVSALSPQQALALLGGATSVRLVRHESVSGVAMTRYKAVIDVTKLAGTVPPAQRAGVRQALRQLGLSKVAMDVWIDGAGYIRLLVTDAVKLATTSTSGSSTASTTTLKLGMGFGAYGAPVTVTVPPASSTVDLGTMLQQASGG